MLHNLLTLAALSGNDPPDSDSPFSKLSKEAQRLIVNAMVGEYDDGPPEIPDSVKAELQWWMSQS